MPKILNFKNRWRWRWIHIECTQDISMLLIIPVIEIDFLLNTFKNFFLKNLNLNYLYTKRHLFFFQCFLFGEELIWDWYYFTTWIWKQKTEQNILSDSSFYAWWYMITITAIAVLIESRILKRSEKFNRLHYWKLKNVFISRGKFLNII